jgi:hypothetical protein
MFDGRNPTNYPLMYISFLVTGQEEIHTVHGIYSFDHREDNILWIYTNEVAGAYYIENVARVISAMTDEDLGVGTFDLRRDTEPTTKALIQLLNQEEEG